MSEFKFIDVLADRIQQDLNMEVDEATTVIKDEIDQLISKMSYDAIDRIIKANKLEEVIPQDEQDIMHDELFCEYNDALYRELGIS